MLLKTAVTDTCLALIVSCHPLQSLLAIVAKNLLFKNHYIIFINKETEKKTATQCNRIEIGFLFNFVIPV